MYCAHGEGFRALLDMRALKKALAGIHLITSFPILKGFPEALRSLFRLMGSHLHHYRCKIASCRVRKAYGNSPAESFPFPQKNWCISCQ
jgi:hypothetical protein